MTKDVVQPNILLDLRSGADNDILAVGGSNLSFSAAKPGALKYDKNTKTLFFTDNIRWVELASTIIKAFTVAYMSVGTQPFNNITTTTIKNWNVVSD